MCELEYKFNVPVCYATGGKSNKGTAVGAQLQDVLEKAEGLGRCIKKNGWGVKYWMLDLPEIEVGRDKSQWIKHWNGYFNFDIDLKAPLAEIGCIEVTEREQKWQRNDGTVNLSVTQVINVIDKDRFNQFMSVCAKIFNIAFGFSFVYAFVTGSGCGFNYVVVGRPDDTDCDDKWKNEEYYNNAYFYTYNNLITTILNAANAKIEDGDTEKHEMQNVCRLLIEHQNKVFDATSVQISRVKYCGTGTPAWYNSNKIYAPVYNVAMEAGAKARKKYEENSGPDIKIENNGLIRLKKGGDFGFDDYLDRMALAYALAVIYKDDKEGGIAFINSIEDKQLDEKKDRRAHLMSTYLGSFGHAYASQRGYDFYRHLTCGDEKEDKTENNDVLFIKEYLSERTAEVYALLKKHKKIEIVAPTGYGKTKMVEKMANMAEQDNKRVVFLVPTNAIADSTYADMIPKNTFDTIANPIKSVRVERGSIYQCDGRSNLYICVYDTGTYGWLNELDPRTDIPVIDEAHTTVSTVYRARTMHKMCDFMKNWDGEMVLLSATPACETHFVSHVVQAKKEKAVTRKAQVVIYDSDCAAVSDAKFIYNLMRQAIYGVPRNENIVIYYDFSNKKMVDEINDIVNKNIGANEKYALYAKTCKKTVETVKSTGWCGDQRVMFVSAYGQYGVNFKPKKKTHVFVFSNGAEVIVQALSRVRTYDMLGSITVYIKKSERLLLDKPLSYYYSTTQRDITKLMEIRDIIKDYTIGAVTHNGRVISKDEKENKYVDASEAVVLKNGELGMLSHYAAMNEIELSYTEIGKQVNTIKLTNNPISKNMYMTKLDDVAANKLLTEHTQRRIKYCRRVYDTYTSGYAQKREYRDLFNSLPDECAFEDIVKLVKSVMLAGNMTPVGLLVRLISHIPDDILTTDYLGAIVMGWISKSCELVRADKECMDELFKELKETVRFGIKNKANIRAAYKIFVKQTLCEMHDEKYDGVNPDFLKRNGTLGLFLGDEKQQWVQAATYVLTDPERGERGELILDTEGFLTKIIDQFALYEKAYYAAKGDEKKANEIVDDIESRVEMMCAEVMRDDDEIARLKAIAGAKGAAAGAAGGAAGGAKTAKKVVAVCNFKCGGNEYHIGDEWGNQADACMKLFGAKTGAARTKLTKMVKNGILRIKESAAEKKRKKQKATKK